VQQFALTSVYPRNIAWLIGSGDWNHFEKVINYNCAMIGGCFNVVIPLTEFNAVSEEYQRFLADYDPDLIILAPGMTSDQLEASSNRISPFGIIPWDSVSSIATLNPHNYVKSGLHASNNRNQKRFGEAFVAVANTAFPDTSWLALVACGDVQPMEPIFSRIDGENSIDATGYREEFFAPLLTNKYGEKHAGAYLEDEQFIPAPNRYQLSERISEEYKFPLSGTVTILNTCFKLQNLAAAATRRSFIGLTVAYHKINGAVRRKVMKFEERPPAVVILVSDSFDLEEASLFWNLRANQIYVAWLSFTALENDLEQVIEWLDSENGGEYYSLWSNNSANVIFNTKDAENSRLQNVVHQLLEKRNRSSGNFVQWSIMKRIDLILHDCIHFPIQQEQVMVMKNESKYTFAPKTPLPFTALTTTLQWNGCMFPQHSQIVRRMISSEVIIQRSQRSIVTTQDISMPRFRITSERYLKAQFEDEQPLEFNRPSPEQIVQILFESAGFARVEQSSTARYHTIFIKRAGELDQATHYLSTSPYRELLDLLSDNHSRNKAGWILLNPAKRRALHHLFLREILGETTPNGTKEYFDTVSDKLPVEVFNLLEKGLLERGFELSCHECSFRSWYPAEHIKQTFECARCFHTQIYNSNPLWLYKLPEVIFQGFEDNMQVPILTLDYFKRKSQHYFEWVPDSNVYQHANDEKALGNIDLLCLCDGKLYIGEAKSNDEIGAEQFSFYEQICRQVAIDGVVFATSQPDWNRATHQRIDRLKTWFHGEILTLTKKDLYVNVN
jgi:hypothetical protein